MKDKKVNLKFGVVVFILLFVAAGGFSQSPKPPPAAVDKTGEPGDWTWLSNTAIPEVQMTRALKQIPQSPPKEAGKIAGQLRSAWKEMSLEGKHAAALLIAAALEQAGDKRTALITYRKIVEVAEGMPYAISADFRLRLVDEPQLAQPGELESLYKDILKQGNGWFFVPQIKTWITPSEAAQHLLQLHDKKLSFRFFKYLWSKSPFPPAYSYLFILLVLTFGIKILELPLFIKTMDNAGKLRYLMPRIESIKSTAPSKSDEHRQITELLHSHGVNPAIGCGVIIVDLIFMVWALYTLVDYSPQFVLDGATFPWAPDIMQRSSGVLIAWAVISAINSLVTVNAQAPVPPGGRFLSSLMGGGVLALIAWFAGWPAYVFIFWILLTAAGIILHSGILGIQRLREY